MVPKTSSLQQGRTGNTCAMPKRIPFPGAAQRDRENTHAHVRASDFKRAPYSFRKFMCGIKEFFGHIELQLEPLITALWL
uniref:Transposase n=1 Tax=Ascaris lumbricoides TaxID=6252 RepID=A0A0M3HUV9_ASCLU